jgi:hypothetical protein
MNKNSSLTKDFLDFYGEFIPVPVELLVNPKYNGGGSNDRISHNSAILYGVLLRLSKRKNEKDENGYITITNKDIANIVGTTTGATVLRMINQLEKFNLIERSEFKQGQPYKLYIKEIEK